MISLSLLASADRTINMRADLHEADRFSVLYIKTEQDTIAIHLPARLFPTIEKLASAFNGAMLDPEPVGLATSGAAAMAITQALVALDQRDLP